jgi:hypothetical protein
MVTNMNKFPEIELGQDMSIFCANNTNEHQRTPNNTQQHPTTPNYTQQHPTTAINTNLANLACQLTLDNLGCV